MGNKVKIAKVVMSVKLEDSREIMEEKLKWKRRILRQINEKWGNNMRVRRIIRGVRAEAWKVRKITTRAHDMKMKHLSDKFRKTKNEKYKVPEEISDFCELSVFKLNQEFGREEARPVQQQGAGGGHDHQCR